MITGASSGIGKEAALKVGEAKGTLLLVARRRELLEETKSEIEGRGGVAHPYVCDLSNPDDIDRMAAQILEQHGHVDVLVNNAGRSIRREIGSSYDRFHDFQRTMQLNYFGPVKLILNLLPHMRERGSGHLINISTAGVQMSGPMFSAYLASKAALDAFSRSIGFEVAGDGIHMTTVHMPLVRTAMAAPTRMFDDFPALSPDEAADLICHAIRKRPARVATALGNLAQATHALAPGLDHSINAAIGRLLVRSPLRKLRPPAAGDRPTVDDLALRESFRRRLESGQIPADPLEVERLTVLLRRIPLFEACTSAELHKLASTAYPIAFEEGEELCSEGEESADCYAVVEGEAALTIQREPVGVVRAGEIVGERGPIEGSPRAATVTATSRVHAYAISRLRLDENTQQQPRSGHPYAEAGASAIRARLPALKRDPPRQDFGVARYCAAMSEENVEIVRRIYDAVERGDIDTVLALYDPEIEWVFGRSPFRIFFKHDTYRGHEGLRRMIGERYHDAWREIEDEIEELIEAGDRVVSVVSSRGRGRASGVEVEKLHAGVWTFRAGKVVRVEWMDREKALKAAGLSESDS